MFSTKLLKIVFLVGKLLELQQSLKVHCFRTIIKIKHSIIKHICYNKNFATLLFIVVILVKLKGIVDSCFCVLLATCSMFSGPYGNLSFLGAKLLYKLGMYVQTSPPQDRYWPTQYLLKYNCFMLYLVAKLLYNSKCMSIRT